LIVNNSHVELDELVELVQVVFALVKEMEQSPTRAVPIASREEDNGVVAAIFL